jgi:hypothetical protein
VLAAFFLSLQLTLATELRPTLVALLAVLGPVHDASTTFACRILDALLDAAETRRRVASSAWRLRCLRCSARRRSHSGGSRPRSSTAVRARRAPQTARPTWSCLLRTTSCRCSYLTSGGTGARRRGSRVLYMRCARRARHRRRPHAAGPSKARHLGEAMRLLATRQTQSNAHLKHRR